jgi:hypothetical protein
VYCDTMFCQVEDMRWETQHPERAIVKSDAMVKRLEDKLRESNIKVHRKRQTSTEQSH